MLSDWQSHSWEWSRNSNYICYVPWLAWPRSKTATLKIVILLMKVTRAGIRKKKKIDDVIFVSSVSLFKVVWRIYLIFHILQTFKKKFCLDFFNTETGCLATASCTAWCCYDFHLLEKNINKITSLQIRKVGKWVSVSNECMIHL